MPSTDLFDHSPPAPIERLARIEGQSNFLSLLAGIEAGPDTTEDMAALSMSRGKGCVPEILEAYAGQSGRFKLPLMTLAFRALRDEYKPKADEFLWMQGAVADAFLLLQRGQCKEYRLRARQFKVRSEIYLGMRKQAYAVMQTYVGEAEPRWVRARFSRGAPETNSRHTPSEEAHTTGQRAAAGHYRAAPFANSDDQWLHDRDYDAKAVGMRDRLGWDDRNSVAGPCTVSRVQHTTTDLPRKE